MNFLRRGLYPIEVAVKDVLAGTARRIARRLNAPNKYGRSGLHDAAASGQLRALDAFIALGVADLDARDDDGRPPSFIAVLHGHDDCAISLLNHGASVEVTDNRGYTLLHLAALHGRLAVVKALLDLGADPNAESTSEFTPLDGAREGGHPEIAELLLARGASRMRDGEGSTGDWIARGDAASEEGDLEGALECFDRALAQNPRAVRAFVHKGNALRHNGELVDAIRSYDHAIAIDPGYSDGIAWGDKGIALHELGRSDEAVACYEEVLKINPKDGVACFNLGVVRHAQGQKDDAIRWFRKALERDSGHRRARAYLEQTLEEKKRDST